MSDMSKVMADLDPKVRQVKGDGGLKKVMYMRAHFISPPPYPKKMV